MDICDNSLTDDSYSSYDGLITRIVNNLFSYDDTIRSRTIDHYYFPNASFSSPLLKTTGLHNIKHILLIWKTINKEPPKIDNICFNGKTCVVFLTQTICPRIMLLSSFVKISLPVTVILEFRETDIDSGLLKIETHQEHWSIEGLLKTIPVVSFWYDHVVRTVMGKILTLTGEAVYTATETASLLLKRNREIEQVRRRLLEEDYLDPDEIEVMMLRIRD